MPERKGRRRRTDRTSKELSTGISWNVQSLQKKEPPACPNLLSCRAILHHTTRGGENDERLDCLASRSRGVRISPNHWFEAFLLNTFKSSSDPLTKTRQNQMTQGIQSAALGDLTSWVDVWSLLAKFLPPCGNSGGSLRLFPAIRAVKTPCSGSSSEPKPFFNLSV